MKCCYLDKPIFKDVVIIGNGPSGIILSLMLDGWTPYLTSTGHPDEFLTARLEGALTSAVSDNTMTEYGLALVHADLLELAQGLEGRTTNPVSLLYDALMRPNADMGLEVEALVKWRRTGHQFAKYGHHCEVESHLKELKIFQKSTNPILRCLYNQRRVNEASWECNQFLRSQQITDNEHYKHAKHIFLIHPFSRFRKGWEIFMSLVYVLEFVTIPLELASLQGKGTRKIHTWLPFGITRFALDIFCVCDTFLNFFTGYLDRKKKEVVMEPLKIIRESGNEYTFFEFYVRFFYETVIMLTRTGTGFRLVRSMYSQLYISFVWLFAMIVYFFLIAYIMGIETSFNASKHKYIEMVRQLHEYMRYKQLPEHLQRRLIRNYEYRFQKNYFRESIIMTNISGHLRQIDHVVLGKGPPGGSWHAMDPHILTLSLASWMALPGLPFTTTNTDGNPQLRASAQEVARYYDNYVRHMELDEYFRSNVIVTQIRPVGEKCMMMRELKPLRSQCEWVQKIKNDWKNHQTICTALKSKANPLCNNNQQPCRRRCIAGYLLTLMPRRCYNTQIPVSLAATDSETKGLIHEIFDPNEDKIVEYRGRTLEEYADDMCGDCQKERAQGTGTRDFRSSFCRGQCNRENNYRGSTKKRKDDSNGDVVGRKGDGYNNTTNKTTNPTVLEANNNSKNKPRPKWLVDTYDKTTRVTTTYTCNTLVLANGAHDLPNKLSLHQPNQRGDDPQQTLAEPLWLLHDVRSLEIELDLYMETRRHGRRLLSEEDGKGIDPVLVVGAGLSAADAILATRKRGIPVLHIFRSKSSDLIKKLPENMYPEYHKIHQMMLGQATPSIPSYTPFPAHTISAIDTATNTVTIVDQHSGVRSTRRVSFAAVLIGSRPDLRFLPPGYKLGKRRTLPVDSKTNTVNIDRATHTVSGFESLYALGPLAGDNFVRFLPGGCLAAVGDMYRKRGITRLE